MVENRVKPKRCVPLYIPCMHWPLSPKNKAEQAAESIKEEFKRLQKALDAEQEVRLKDLADEERDKICTMELMVAQAEEGVASLSKLIEKLKREMGDEDTTFMQVTVVVDDEV